MISESMRAAHRPHHRGTAPRDEPWLAEDFRDMNVGEELSGDEEEV